MGTASSVINEQGSLDYYTTGTGITLMGRVKQYDSLAKMLAEKNPGAYAVVADASADPTVKSGGAIYKYIGGGANKLSSWKKIQEDESLDLDKYFDWKYIANRPTSTAEQIDTAVADAHIHSNQSILENLSITIVEEEDIQVPYLRYAGKIIYDPTQTRTNTANIAVNADNIATLNGRVDTLETVTIPGLDTRLSTLEDTTIPELTLTVDNHVSDSTHHVTTEDKELWNTVRYKATPSDVATAKAEAIASAASYTDQEIGTVSGNLTSHAADTNIHVTAELQNAWNGNITAFETHAEDTDSHVTAELQTAWNDAAAAIPLKANAADVYTKAQVYTKEETVAAINEKVASVFRYKGSKTTLAEVEALDKNSGVDAPVVGDVWNVTSAGTHGTGAEYVCKAVDNTTGVGTWEELGTAVDLSAYVTSANLNNTLANYLLTSTFNSTIADYVTASSLNESLADYATTTALNTALTNYYNKSQVYTKTEVDALTINNLVISANQANTTKTLVVGEWAVLYGESEVTLPEANAANANKLVKITVLGNAVGSILNGNIFNEDNPLDHIAQLTIDVKQTLTFVCQANGSTYEWYLIEAINL